MKFRLTVELEDVERSGWSSFIGGLALPRKCTSWLTKIDVTFTDMAASPTPAGCIRVPRSLLSQQLTHACYLLYVYAPYTCLLTWDTKQMG